MFLHAQTVPYLSPRFLSNQRVLSSLASLLPSFLIQPEFIQQLRTVAYECSSSDSTVAFDKHEIDKVAVSFPLLVTGLKIIQLISDYIARVCSMKLFAIRSIKTIQIRISFCERKARTPSWRERGEFLRHS